MRSDRIKKYAPIASALLLFSSAASSSARPPLTSLNEYGSLTLENNKGSTINERGRGSGTFNCNVYIQLTLNGTRVTAKYSAYPRGGSIIGTAIAHIHSATTRAAYFSGTISLARGSGRYASSSGTASFQGTINRTSYAMTVRVLGRVRL